MSEKWSESSKTPDIEFTASVRARKLHFEEVPETEVRFSGPPKRASVSSTERENLPEEVRRGVTYRNSSIRLRIATGLIEMDPNVWEEKQ